MPKMPAWADGGRIIYDKEFPFAFVRRNRREPWEALVKRADGWMTTGETSMKLDKCRDMIISEIARSIGMHVLALHPGARLRHMRRTYNSHLCDAPYGFRTAENLEEADCPLCIAVVAEDVQAKMKGVGSKAIEEQREHVRQVREFNALGQLVTGEDATTKL